MKRIKFGRLLPFAVVVLALSLGACSFQSEDENAGKPDPMSPALEAMSLIQYFYFRGGSATVDTLELTPEFNPDNLNYSAASTSGYHALVFPAQIPHVGISGTFNGDSIPLSKWMNNWPCLNGYHSTISVFKTTLTDSLSGFQRTYTVSIETK